jgi:hypothetical protein
MYGLLDNREVSRHGINQHLRQECEANVLEADLA